MIVGDPIAVSQKEISVPRPLYPIEDLFLPALLELELPAYAPLEIYFTFPPTPDHVVDITDVMDKKLEALEKHQSQLEHIPQWREGIKLMGSKLAEDESFTYAESFKRLPLTYQ